MSISEIPTEIGSATDSATDSAIAWLERIAGDWSLLDTLSVHERQRLHRAIAALSTADPAANRRRRKNAKADDVRREEAVLNETGIRARRRRPVITTPNVFPPPVETAGVVGNTAPSVDRVCYVCKEPYSQLHDFYDQLCPGCATVNFAAHCSL